MNVLFVLVDVIVSVGMDWYKYEADFPLTIISEKNSLFVSNVNYRSPYYANCKCFVKGYHARLYKYGLELRYL